MCNLFRYVGARSVDSEYVYFRRNFPTSKLSNEYQPIYTDLLNLFENKPQTNKHKRKMQIKINIRERRFHVQLGTPTRAAGRPFRACGGLA